MKQKSLAKLKKELWDLKSRRIRRESADENGIAECVSCGVKKDWRLLQGGHFVPQSMGDALRFEDMNIHPQCVACNVYQKEKGSFLYGKYMVKKYGDKIFEEFNERRKMWQMKNMKYTRADIQEMIDEEKKKAKDSEGFIFGKR